MSDYKYYAYYASSHGDDNQKDESINICKAMNFAASEAYKLLRANLMFTLPDDTSCRVVGITSASRGEGKSTTAINLAYTIAEAGKKVLLMDCDLRLPSIARKLGIDKTPGVSNYLIGKALAKDAVKQSKVHNNLYILPAGDIPPNPSELLGSNRMRESLEALKISFNFIIIDLPPVNVVSDTLAISKYLNGIIVAVRDNYSSQKEVRDAIDHLKFANSNILGFVYTSRSDEKLSYKYRGRRYYYYNKYGKYRYSKKYAKGYNAGYMNGYENAYGNRPTIDLEGMPVHEDVQKQE